MHCMEIACGRSSEAMAPTARPIGQWRAGWASTSQLKQNPAIAEPTLKPPERGSEDSSEVGSKGLVTGTGRAVPDDKTVGGAGMFRLRAKSVGHTFILLVSLFSMAFAAFLVYATWAFSKDSMQRLLRQQAALALEFDLAIRSYVADDVRPIASSWPAPTSSSGGHVNLLRCAHGLRPSAPDIPRVHHQVLLRQPAQSANQAGRDELRILRYFIENPAAKTWVGEITLDGEPYLAHFSARRMTASCLQCHGDPANAPAALLERYGSVAGFHRSLGTVMATDTIAIPLTSARQALSRQVLHHAATLALGLLLLVGAILIVFRWTVSRRLSAITRHFRYAAEQPPEIGLHPMEVDGTDEIAILAAGFNSLAGKLQASYDRLAEHVEERTAELKAEVAERRRAEEHLRAARARLQRQNETLTCLAADAKRAAETLDAALACCTAAAARTLAVARASVCSSMSGARPLCAGPVRFRSGPAQLRVGPEGGRLSGLLRGPADAAHDRRPGCPHASGYARVRHPYLAPLGITSMLDAPIRMGGEVVGVLCLEHIGPQRTWTQDEQSFAGSVADLVALALHQEERRRQRRSCSGHRITSAGFSTAPSPPSTPSMPRVRDRHQ